MPPGGQALTTSQQQSITSALRATPGTLGYLTEALGTANVADAGSLTSSPIQAARRRGRRNHQRDLVHQQGQVDATPRVPKRGLTDGTVNRMTIGGKTVSARITGQVYALGSPGVPGPC